MTNGALEIWQRFGGQVSVHHLRDRFYRILTDTWQVSLKCAVKPMSQDVH